MKNLLFAHIDGAAHVHSGDVTVIIICAVICAAVLFLIRRTERN